MRQYLERDVMFGEQRGVLLKPKFVQPFPDAAQA